MQQAIDAGDFARFLAAFEATFDTAPRRLRWSRPWWARLPRQHARALARKPWAQVLEAEIQTLDRRDGIVLEFGVHGASSINYIARRLPDAEIHGFDSFKGFPDDGRPDWTNDFALSKLPKVRANVTLHVGFFADTLPEFVRNNERDLSDRLLLLHVDCDIYSSAATVFENLGRFLGPGKVIVFDELANYPHFQVNEALALYRHLVAWGIDARWNTVFGDIWPYVDAPNGMPERAMCSYRAREFYQNHSVLLCPAGRGGWRDVASGMAADPALTAHLAELLQARGHAVT